MQTTKLKMNLTLQLNTCNDYCVQVTVPRWEDFFDEGTEREDVALVLFTVNNNIITYVDNSNPDNMKWCLENIASGTYIYVVAVLKFNEDTVYEDGDISFKDGEIRVYQQLLTPPDEWIEFNLEGILNDAHSEDLQIWWNYLQTVECCIEKNIYPVACNKFVVKPNEHIVNSGEEMFINVYSYNTPVTNSDLIYEHTYTPEDVDDIHTVELENDGIYIFQYGIVVDDENIVVREDIIYVICDISACYKKMIDKILCGGEILCDEPDSDCPPDRTINYMVYWTNMFHSLWFYLISLIEYEQGKYLGLHVIYDTNGLCIDSEQEDILKEINKTFIKIQDLVTKCGGCGNESIDDNEPCYDCN